MYLRFEVREVPALFAAFNTELAQREAQAKRDLNTWVDRIAKAEKELARLDELTKARRPEGEAQAILDGLLPDVEKLVEMFRHLDQIAGSLALTGSQLIAAKRLVTHIGDRMGVQ